MKRIRDLLLVLVAGVALAGSARADLKKCFDLGNPVAAAKRIPSCVQQAVNAAQRGGGLIRKLFRVGLTDYVKLVKTTQDVLVCFARGAGSFLPKLLKDPAGAVGGLVSPAFGLIKGIPLAAGKELLRTAADVWKELTPIGERIIGGAKKLSTKTFMELPLRYLDAGWTVAKRHWKRLTATAFAMLERRLNVWPVGCLLKARGMTERMEQVLLQVGDGIISATRVVYKELVLTQMPKLLEKLLSKMLVLILPDLPESMAGAVMGRILELDQKLGALRKGDEVDLSSSAMSSFLAALDELPSLGGVFVKVVKKLLMKVVHKLLDDIKQQLKEWTKQILDAVSANLLDTVVSEALGIAVPVVINLAALLLSSESGGWAKELTEVSHTIVSTLTELLNISFYWIWDPFIWPYLIEWPLDQVWDFTVGAIVDRVAEFGANLILRPVGQGIDMAVTKIRDKIAQVVPVPKAVEAVLKKVVEVWDKLSPPQAAMLKAHAAEIKGLVQDLVKHKSPACLKAIPPPPEPPSSPWSRMLPVGSGRHAPLALCQVVEKVITPINTLVPKIVAGMATKIKAGMTQLAGNKLIRSTLMKLIFNAVGGGGSSGTSAASGTSPSRAPATSPGKTSPGRGAPKATRSAARATPGAAGTRRGPPSLVASAAGLTRAFASTYRAAARGRVKVLLAARKLGARLGKLSGAARSQALAALSAVRRGVSAMFRLASAARGRVWGMLKRPSTAGAQAQRLLAVAGGPARAPAGLAAELSASVAAFTSAARRLIGAAAVLDPRLRPYAARLEAQHRRSAQAMSRLVSVTGGVR